MLDKVNYAIMNAFFSRSLEEQVFNVSPADNEDLAKAAIEAMLEPTEDMIREGAMIMPDYDPSDRDFLECWKAAINQALDK